MLNKVQLFVTKLLSKKLYFINRNAKKQQSEYKEKDHHGDVENDEFENSFNPALAIKISHGFVQIKEDADKGSCLQVIKYFPMGNIVQPAE